MGSLILPANRAALYAIKPTVSYVSIDGIVPISRLFDSPGPMTKCAFDLAIALDVLIPATNHVSFVTGQWTGLRIGTLDPNIWEFPPDARRHVLSAEIQMVRLTPGQRDAILANRLPCYHFRVADESKISNRKMKRFGHIIRSKFL